MNASLFVRPFDELDMNDVPLVGGKNASLGEMVQHLDPLGVRVPSGFAVTAEAYRHFLETSGLDETIEELLSGLDTEDVEDLRQRGKRLRQAIRGAELPEELATAILDAYLDLSDEVAGGIDVAVRSSATAEDLPDASFAGQQETYLNIRGEASLLEACRRCFASLYTDRAISYRVDKGFGQTDVALSVGVQRMVRSDKAAAGVMFSIDTETGFRNAVVINSAYGLGETVVQGSVNPDEFTVFKPTLKEGYEPILQKVLGSKEFKLIYDEGGERGTRTVATPEEDRNNFSISDEDVLTLARWACQIEDHYGDVRDQPTPMDIEWAKDGRTGDLFVVQARPETVQSQRATDVLQTWHLEEKGTVLVEGRAVGQQIASGGVRVVESPSQLHEFEKGEVLVSERTDPDWEPIMKKAAAIVTDKGGRTCHAAIVSRELGVPAVIGTGDGTGTLNTGDIVTVSCAEGDTGRVYEGELGFRTETVPLEDTGHPETPILLNVGNPSEAFRFSFLPVDGVGLARVEFIITSSIQIHPMALIEYDELDDDRLRAEIDRRTQGYDDKPAFFVDRLAQGIGMIGAAFHPRPVIVRMSDFKTNEYAALLGGERYEQDEENPMIGFRGASRYTDDRYRPAFGLECRALRKVREAMGLRNVKMMIPFCRTVEEGRRVLEEMARHGLEPGREDLEVYVMCEIPSNVVCAAAFAEIFDGFSIGSNDLTQLVLGVDRDSEQLAHLFDERDPAVREMMRLAIERAHEAGKPIGICGQAPSDYPEVARFLVEAGIDSISLNPDAVLPTIVEIQKLEQE